MVARVRHAMTPCHFFLFAPRLKQKLPAILSRFASLGHQPVREILQALHDGRADQARHAPAEVGRSRSHGQRRDHAEFIVQSARWVGVDGERTLGLVCVEVDQTGVAAAHNGNRGTDWKSLQIIRLNSVA